MSAWTGFGFGGVRRYRPKRKKKRSKHKSQQFKDAAFKGRATVKCHWCRRKLTRSQATTDHVRPLSGGGHDRKGNYVISCGKCNSKKAAKSAGEHAEHLRAMSAESAPEGGK